MDDITEITNALLNQPCPPDCGCEGEDDCTALRATRLLRLQKTELDELRVAIIASEAKVAKLEAAVAELNRAVAKMEVV